MLKNSQINSHALEAADFFDIINDHKLLKSFGISRVGDLTSLDIIGIPVWFASRPNSRSLSVSHGKGICAKQAQISAIMEAVEAAVSERFEDHVVIEASISELMKSNLNIVPFPKLSRCNIGEINKNKVRCWVKGFCLSTSVEIYAPYELIGTDMRHQMAWDHNSFRMTSTGLGAGNTLDSAILHGLFEVIEADACMLTDIFGIKSSSATLITWVRGVNRRLDHTMERLLEAKIAVHIFRVNGKIRIPTYTVCIRHEFLSSKGPAYRYCGGSAARLDASDAILAALLEAIQSRLTCIAAARDDLEKESFHGARDSTDIEFADEDGILLSSDASKVHSNKQISTPGQTFDYLFENGLEEAYIFPLATGVSELKVVRVLANGLGISTQEMTQLTVADILNLGEN